MDHETKFSGSADPRAPQMLRPGVMSVLSAGCNFLYSGQTRAKKRI